MFKTLCNLSWLKLMQGHPFCPHPLYLTSHFHLSLTCALVNLTFLALPINSHHFPPLGLPDTSFSAWNAHFHTFNIFLSLKIQFSWHVCHEVSQSWDIPWAGVSPASLSSHQIVFLCSPMAPDQAVKVCSLPPFLGCKSLRVGSQSSLSLCFPQFLCTVALKQYRS